MVACESERKTMLQYSLTQLLMAVTLAAILLTLVRSEGCGAPHSLIGSADFSPDGKRLAVARYDARDANVPLKRYKADVSRTISVVDVELGTILGVAGKVLKRGNQGPAFDLFRRGRKAVVFGKNPDTLFILDFSGARIMPFDFKTRQWQQSLVSNAPDFYHMAISQDRTLLAGGKRNGVELWNLTSNNQPLDITTDGDPFLGSPLIALSADDNLVATAGAGIGLWDARTGAPHKKSYACSDFPTALVFSSTGHILAAAFEDGLSIYDVDRDEQRDLLREHVSSMAFSPDGNQIAVGLAGGVAVLDVATGKTMKRTSVVGYAACLAFSPDGHSIAIGQFDGDLALWDTGGDGNVRWITVPGGDGYSWLFPAVALGIWGYVSWCLWKRRRNVKTVSK
jgi:WD40 repeat protein